jgi:hypothetical protein
MTEFFASGRSIDLVLLLIGLEAIGLIVLWRMRRCPVPPLATLLILAPGSCLLLAARAALTGTAWGWVSFFLLVALIIHLVDLRQRWQDWDRKNSANSLRGK